MSATRNDVTTSSHRKVTDWFKQQRMAFIAEMLKVYGFINTSHLQRKFGISKAQATADLARFAEENPKSMSYNARARRYEAQTVSREEATRVSIAPMTAISHTNNTVEPFEPVLRQNLIKVSNAYTKAVGISLNAASRRVYGDAVFLDRVHSGTGGFTVRIYDEAISAFHSLWPDGVRWPDLTSPFHLNQERNENVKGKKIRQKSSLLVSIATQFVPLPSSLEVSEPKFHHLRTFSIDQGEGQRGGVY